MQTRDIALPWLLFLGCAKPTLPHEDAADTPVDLPADTDTDAVDATWADMNADERTAYMSTVVLPQMRALFESFDPAWSTMTCQTCHGADGAANDWRMPNGLHPLDTYFFPLPTVWGSPGEEALSRFMLEEVTTAMADLLDQPLFDQAAPLAGGFGCFGCHAIGATTPP